MTDPCLVARHALLGAGLGGVPLLVELALLEVAQDLLAVDRVEEILRGQLILKSKYEGWLD